MKLWISTQCFYHSPDWKFFYTLFWPSHCHKHCHQINVKFIFRSAVNSSEGHVQEKSADMRILHDMCRLTALMEWLQSVWTSWKEDVKEKCVATFIRHLIFKEEYGQLSNSQCRLVKSKGVWLLASWLWCRNISPFNENSDCMYIIILWYWLQLTSDFCQYNVAVFLCHLWLDVVHFITYWNISSIKSRRNSFFWILLFFHDIWYCLVIFLLS